MTEIIHELASSPALALLGAAVLLTLLLIPIALRLAGLTGSQIVELLTTWAKLLPELVRELRDGDDDDDDDQQPTAA